MDAVGETSKGPPEREVTLHLLLFVVFLFLKDQPSKGTLYAVGHTV